MLSKPERLSEEEFREIKKHPGMGANILSCMEMFSNTGEIVCAHHELSLIHISENYILPVIVWRGDTTTGKSLLKSGL